MSFLCPQKAKKETKPWLIKGPRRTEASQVSGAGASFWSSAHGFKSKKARNITPDQRLILRSSSRAHRWTWKSSLKLSQELLQNPYGYLTPDK
ncbi:hypothetical protein LB507_000817 [Fusarium sp. FIESC RH6]|nr:hypothetical protein LB507_000817 [Fusarium sp. FIESC RH6]